MSEDQVRAWNEAAADYRKAVEKMVKQGLPVPLLGMTPGGSLMGGNVFGGSVFGGSPMGGSLMGGSLMGGGVMGGLMNPYDYLNSVSWNQYQMDQNWPRIIKDSPREKLEVEVEDRDDVEGGKMKKKKKAKKPRKPRSEEAMKKSAEALKKYQEIYRRVKKEHPDMEVKEMRKMASKIYKEMEG